MTKKIHLPIVFVFCLVAVALLWNTALAKTLYVERNTVEIKKGQGAFYPTVYKAKRGDALEVISQKGQWFQVNTPNGAGWVFEKAVNEKKPGFKLTSLLGKSDSSELDKTAGFKGFDAPTEEAYVSANNLKAEIRIVDRLQKPAFTPNELNNFMKQGRVGQSGGAQ